MLSRELTVSTRAVCRYDGTACSNVPAQVTLIPNLFCFRVRQGMSGGMEALFMRVDGQRRVLGRKVSERFVILMRVFSPVHVHK